MNHEKKIMATNNFMIYDNPGNPGMRIRLTKKGVNQLKNVGVGLLNERIARLSGYKTVSLNRILICHMRFRGIAF